MTEQRSQQDRENLLADVAELYYLKGRDQTEIAEKIGVTRSMISRMLKEARERGIVDIRVHRSFRLEPDLEASLIKRFGLMAASVLSQEENNVESLLVNLGNAGARVLKQYLEPGTILGLSWGTSISATVDAFEINEPILVKVVQLVGALGARNSEYDGHDLVLRLNRKLGGESYFLNAPYFCQTPQTARSMMETPSIKETIDLGKKTQVALLGIGTTLPKYSSFYLAGYVPIEELDHIRAQGAVGDVCGIHFDINGRLVYEEFNERLVAIQKDDFFKIPLRIAVAGGAGKVMPVLGALRGGFINVLVTDSFVAKKILEIT
jgi:deoxyribonucleoside regulator